MEDDSTQPVGGVNAHKRKKDRRRDLAALDWVRDDLDGSLNPDEFAVLAYLAMRCDGKHECFPSQKDIAGRFSRGLSWVQYQLKRLEKRGFIQRKRRRSTSTLYTLNVGFIPETESAQPCTSGHADVHASKGDLGHVPEHASGYVNSHASGHVISTTLKKTLTSTKKKTLTCSEEQEEGGKTPTPSTMVKTKKPGKSEVQEKTVPGEEEKIPPLTDQLKITAVVLLAIGHGHELPEDKRLIAVFDAAGKDGCDAHDVVGCMFKNWNSYKPFAADKGCWWWKKKYNPGAPPLVEDLVKDGCRAVSAAREFLTIQQELDAKKAKEVAAEKAKKAAEQLMKAELDANEEYQWLRGMREAIKHTGHSEYELATDLPFFSERLWQLVYQDQPIDEKWAAELLQDAWGPVTNKMRAIEKLVKAQYEPDNQF